MFYTISSKTIEDFLISIKKLFEKNLVSFNEAKNLIRKFSREIFYLLYKRAILRNKVINGSFREDKKLTNILNIYIKKDNNYKKNDK